MEGPGI
jgi:hypothetical protein